MTSKTRTFLCYWDSNGFETIADCTSWEHQTLLNEIAGRELKPAPVNLHAMMMRARLNSQRNPEIWIFETTKDVDIETLWRYTKENTTAFIKLIQECGKKLY